MSVQYPSTHAIIENALRVHEDWSVHDDDQGHLFYYNLKTKESVWQVPPPLAAIEGECMMALMIQRALARSGDWTAHDTGNGTLYYFNKKTRTSVWERPSEWNDNTENQTKSHSPPVRPSEILEPLITLSSNTSVDSKAKKKKKKPSSHSEGNNRPAKSRQENQELALQLTQVEQINKKEEIDESLREKFYQLLRDKNVMPFSKWSAVFPRIVTDPRFVAIPNMDDRLELFNAFVSQRREDIATVKKRKEKEAKSHFIKSLQNEWNRKLATLEDQKSTIQDAINLSKLEFAGSSCSILLSSIKNEWEDKKYKELEEISLQWLSTKQQDKLWNKAWSGFVKLRTKEVEQYKLFEAFVKKHAKEHNGFNPDGQKGIDSLLTPLAQQFEKEQQEIDKDFVLLTAAKEKVFAHFVSNNVANEVQGKITENTRNQDDNRVGKFDHDNAKASKSMQRDQVNSIDRETGHKRENCIRRSSSRDSDRNKQRSQYTDRRKSGSSGSERDRSRSKDSDRNKRESRSSARYQGSKNRRRSCSQHRRNRRSRSLDSEGKYHGRNHQRRASGRRSRSRSTGETERTYNRTHQSSRKHSRSRSSEYESRRRRRSRKSSSRSRSKRKHQHETSSSDE